MLQQLVPTCMELALSQSPIGCRRGVQRAEAQGDNIGTHPAQGLPKIGPVHLTASGSA